jgi:hypothetical protein
MLLAHDDIGCMYVTKVAIVTTRLNIRLWKFNAHCWRVHSEYTILMHDILMLQTIPNAQTLLSRVGVNGKGVNLNLTFTMCVLEHFIFMSFLVDCVGRLLWS